MRKGRLILLIVIILVIVGTEIYVLSQCSRRAAESAEAVPTPTSTPIILTPTPAPTTEPSPTPEASDESSDELTSEEPAETASEETEATPNPTETPIPTETPEPSESPEPNGSAEPTATPTTNGPVPTDPPQFASVTDYGTLINQGSFSSNTGLSLNLNIFWAAYDNGTDDIQLHLIGTLSSGVVQHGPHSYGAAIQYAGISTTAATNMVIVTNPGLVETELFDTVIAVPRGTEDTMTVSYDYGGSYSGVYTPTITAVGIVRADLPDDGTVHYTSEHD